jgi:hypothetical protein
MSADSDDARIIRRLEKVVCEECDQFAMEKGYKGASATAGERAYADIDLPDECPVCGADLVTVSGGDFR